jgi:Sulfotransferase domain
MAGIIWLASYPKSGNTWARIFIENLLRDSDRPADINARKFFGVGEASVEWWRRVTDRPLRSMDNIAAAGLRPKVHLALTRLSPENVVVKTHNALIEYAGVPQITTALTAGAIYILRNPLDLCLSFADHFGVTVDRAIKMMATDNLTSPSTDDLAFECLSSWSSHVDSWTVSPHPRLLTVRYEDMQTAPVETFGRLARHLGHAPSPECLMRAIENSSFGKLRAQEDEEGFVERSENARRFFRVGASGQWRNQLSKLQVRRLIEAHGETMRRFGYLDKQGAPVA